MGFAGGDVEFGCKLKELKMGLKRKLTIWVAEKSAGRGKIFEDKLGNNYRE